MDIKTKLVSGTRWKTKCPYDMQPEFIVIHNTANDASAENEAEYMINNSNEASFHYVVDDKNIYQCIPENRNAWHAGDGAFGKGNRQGIAIEICYSMSGGEKFLKAEENAAKLVARILKKYGWKTDRVKPHQLFSGKYCPHRTLDLGWERFLKMVEENMMEEIILVEDIVGELSGRGILSNVSLWLNKLSQDEDAYHLARKTVNYIRREEQWTK